MTYEDTNCPGAGSFDSTGQALVKGAVDYLRPRVASLMRLVREETRLLPVPGGWRVSASVRGLDAWTLHGVDGRLLGSGRFSGGTAFIPSAMATSRPAVVRFTATGTQPPRTLLLPSATP